MKKFIVSILLVLLMSVSIVITACAPSTPKADPGAEISFTVPNDSNVPEPAYSAKLKKSIVDTFMLFYDGIDREELEWIINDNILPLCSKAKISEANLNKIVNYFKNNKSKIDELIDTMSQEEPPADMKAFTTSYFALLKGAFDVLNADDFGKLMFVVLQDEDMYWYDSELASVVKDIGRDNFIIVSRFMFKIMGVSLEKRESMIDILTNFMESLVNASERGDYEGLNNSEIFELFKMLIEMEYSVYETVTDNEINKLIEIFVDVYAKISNHIGENTVSATEKNELVTKYKALVADYRAIVKLAYKTVLRIDVEIFEKDDGYFDLFDNIFDAYDNDLTAAEKTLISDMLKTSFTEAQYYKETKTEEYRYYEYYYYDDKTGEDVNVYYVNYYISFTKETQKQFNAPAKLLSDPIGALKIVKNAAVKDFENKKNQFTQEEQELYDFFELYAKEIVISIFVEMSFPANIFDNYSWEYEEVRTPA